MVWWIVAGIVFTIWAAYTLYRTGYRDGHSDAMDGRPAKRW